MADQSRLRSDRHTAYIPGCDLPQTRRGYRRVRQAYPLQPSRGQRLERSIRVGLSVEPCLFVPGRHHRLDAAPHAEIACDRHLPRIESGHQVIEDAVSDILMKMTFV